MQGSPGCPFHQGVMGFSGREEAPSPQENPKHRQGPGWKGAGACCIKVCKASGPG